METLLVKNMFGSTAFFMNVRRNTCFQRIFDDAFDWFLTIFRKACASSIVCDEVSTKLDEEPTTKDHHSRTKDREPGTKDQHPQQRTFWCEETLCHVSQGTGWYVAMWSWLRWHNVFWYRVFCTQPPNHLPTTYQRPTILRHFSDFTKIYFDFTKTFF